MPIDRTKTELDNILGDKFSVLDDGFIRVVDYMGGDNSIVQAARVSYGEGTKKVHEDRGLIRYLMRHHHSTPFEMCEIKFHVRVPMDCWRQWIRHRTANVNEYSTRYSLAIDAAQATNRDDWRLQASGNRQGSDGNIREFPEDWEHPKYLADKMKSGDAGEYLSIREKSVLAIAREVYEERLEFGVAREQARKDLPLSTYTEAYWKIDLHNLLHFLRLRMDDHAQEEIREYATVIGEEIVGKWCPLVWEAFLDYRVNSKGFTRLEADIFKDVVSNKPDEAIKNATSFGWLDKRKNGELKSNRERLEFENKLTDFGLNIPWG